MNKPKWLENDRRVQSWLIEADGIEVVTEYGYAFEPSEDHNSAEHVHIFENSKVARSELKFIRPCGCERCTSRGKAIAAG